MTKQLQARLNWINKQTRMRHERAADVLQALSVNIRARSI